MVEFGTKFFPAMAIGQNKKSHDTMGLFGFPLVSCLRRPGLPLPPSTFGHHPDGPSTQPTLREMDRAILGSVL